MLNIAVETRASTVVGHEDSLSVFLRLTRPLRRMAGLGRARLFERPTSALLAQPDIPYDILFVNRPTTTESFLLIERARTMGVPVVVDIDDWMYSTPSYGDHLLRDRTRPVQSIYDNADILTLPTSFFSQVMTPLFAGPRIVLPYGFDFDGVRAPAPFNDTSRTMILSSMFTLKLGRRIAEFSGAIKAFLDRNETWDIDFYCENYDPALFAHPRVNLLPPVSFETYLRLLREKAYAFSLVPLSGYEEEEELLFNACKSPLKFIDYGANRIGGIYSRSPVYETVIEDRRTGILVENTYEGWYSALCELAEDGVLRKGVCDASYEAVRDRFSLRHALAAIETAVEIARP